MELYDGFHQTEQQKKKWSILLLIFGNIGIVSILFPHILFSGPQKTNAKEQIEDEFTDLR
jgi:hypothetical protein